MIGSAVLVEVLLFLLLLNMEFVGPLFVFSENDVDGVAEELAGGFFLLPLGWTPEPLYGVDGSIGAGAGELTGLLYWDALRTPVLVARPSLSGEWIRDLLDAAASSSTVSWDIGLAVSTVGRLPEMGPFLTVPCWKGGAGRGGTFELVACSSSIGYFAAPWMSSASCITWSTAPSADYT